MSGKFIDTNVFIYLFDETDEHKRTIAERLIQKVLETRSACISHQVVQETLNVVTRKLPSPMKHRKRPAIFGKDLDALMANHAQSGTLPARP
jgi:predicted nucleic acid-binding protein